MLNLNKGISTPIVITIIIILAIILIGGVFAYQYYWLPRQEIEEPYIIEESYIKLISPNGGEEWKIGNTYTIKWDSYGVTELVIGIIDYSAPEDCLLNDRNSISADLGEYTFKLESCTSHNVGADQKTNLSPGNQYKILIQDKDHPEAISDFSDDYFSVIGDETADWNIYRNEEYGFEFKYPEKFFWQEPEAKISECDNINFPEECPDIKTDSSSPIFEEEKITINDMHFCLKKTSEGAAGSTYTSYYYTTVKDEKCFTIYLILRYTNCGVFGSSDEEAYQECQYDNEIIKPETLNQILSTFRFIET